MKSTREEITDALNGDGVWVKDSRPHEIHGQLYHLDAPGNSFTDVATAENIEPLIADGTLVDVDGRSRCFGLPAFWPKKKR